MHCTKQITADLTWVGANDRRLALFEGVYSVPAGVSYNSYLLTDDKTVLFDTADKAVQHRFIENVTEALGGRKLDYLIVQHMEPDHTAALREIISLHPGVKVVCTAMAAKLMEQFYNFGEDFAARSLMIVKEGDTLVTGRHTLLFVAAPMVHWPEVMVTYDQTDGILFSADAFGCFGALNGAIFADEVDFERDYMDEARRYYTNIVGKYGTQVQTLLTKASALDIKTLCPLHGFVWRSKIGDIVSKYEAWSAYEPEERGVMLAYASVYGNTENAAEILACRLRDGGVKTVMYDVSVTPASEIVAAAFKYSHLVFASTTYNAGIFISMEALINDLAAHNIQNRTVGIIENGSWAATSGGLIREKLSACENIRFIENTASLKSGISPAALTAISAMADELTAELAPADVKPTDENKESQTETKVDPSVMFKLSYGLFILTAKDGAKDNGCVINTAAQLTSSPLRISIAVNKANFTHDMIKKTGEFNLSVLSESASFGVFERFGFSSGKDTDKFKGDGSEDRAANGIRYLTEYTNGVISGKVAETLDCGTHTLFIADVTQSFATSGEPSATYQYYFDHIKPRPKPTEEKKKGFVCKICGYVYEGDTLPEDFVCPICKHGPEDFEERR